MDWQIEYDTLRREVRSYSEELAGKPHAVVFTKMDLMGDLEPPPVEASDAFATFAISAANREGLEELKAGLWARLLEMKKEERRRAVEAPLP
jgi:GTPase involved in cell partitioning and DNA repair